MVFDGGLPPVSDNIYPAILLVFRIHLVSDVLRKLLSPLLIGDKVHALARSDKLAVCALVDLDCADARRQELLRGCQKQLLLIQTEPASVQFNKQLAVIAVVVAENICVYALRRLLVQDGVRSYLRLIRRVLRCDKASGRDHKSLGYRRLQREVFLHQGVDEHKLHALRIGTVVFLID